MVKEKIRDFKKPWNNFTKHAKDNLEETVVTFKSNNSIISKPQNKYTHGFTEKGKPIKFEQKDNPRWMAVRRSMFKEPQGVIHLKEVYEEKSILKAIEIQIDRMLVQNTSAMRLAPYVYDQEARRIIKDLIDRIGISIQEKDALLNEIKKYLKKNKLKDISGNDYESIKIAEFQEYAAKRVKLDNSFDHKKIDKIPYTKIGKSVLGKLLHEHLDSIEYEGKPELAFSGEGLESLAKKVGKPVTKVTIAEKKDFNSKFGKQFVEVDAGAVTYFVMYENQVTKERDGFASLATHKAIERLNDKTKQGIADEREGYDLIILSPGDLVYVPTKEEREKIKHGANSVDLINWDDKKNINERIYSVTRFSKKQCYFLKSTISDLIIPYDSDKKIGEYGSQNYSEKSNDDIKVIDTCIKLKIDRLGNIKPAV